ncbi:MAG: hypothetical protein F6J95_030650 [Leptolyngbya sp. SIO1E4]|nr:hypothetical protein [Leptolyngbya sp. SIO1E4]
MATSPLRRCHRPHHRIHLHAPKAGTVTVDRSESDGFIDEIHYTMSDVDTELNLISDPNPLDRMDEEE